MSTPSPILQSWQRKLIDAGFPLPKFGADGYGGAETRDAILAFQRAHPPLELTGQFDDATRTALNPPHSTSIPPGIATAVAEAAINLVLPPSPEKALIMNFLPTIVQWIIALVPGIPDDIAKVRAEIEELASNDDGLAKVRSFIAFARVMLNEAEAVVNKIDPHKAVVASTPIPAPVAALAPKTM
jgi:hypothetical protein